jgi:hypothetical protein
MSCDRARDLRAIWKSTWRHHRNIWRARPGGATNAPDAPWIRRRGNKSRTERRVETATTLRVRRVLCHASCFSHPTLHIGTRPGGGLAKKKDEDPPRAGQWRGCPRGSGRAGE